MSVDLSSWLSPLATALDSVPPARRVGSVIGVIGTLIRVALPDVHVGQLCRVDGSPPVLAEVIGFDSSGAMLMPLGPVAGVAVRARVEPIESTLTVPAGAATLGRVINALGEPIDGRGPIHDATRAPLHRPPPNPMRRKRILEPLGTGVRAIDTLLPIGRGQRVGIFSAAGVGKTTLLGMIARHVQADRVVVALIGERGREVVSFLEDNLGPDGLAKATIVVSTSDEPALLRARAAEVASAIAEEARDRGEHVVLMMDSVTRYARALRDIGLAVNEPPGRQGYPPSVYQKLPQLFERAGNDERGSITGLYTVLVAGDDMNEPIADETRSLLDGHIVLSRKIAAVRRPAIDVLDSESRLAYELTRRPGHAAAAGNVREILSLYQQNADKIALGLYDPPSVTEKRKVGRVEEVNRFLNQTADEPPAPFGDYAEHLVDRFGT